MAIIVTGITPLLEVFDLPVSIRHEGRCVPLSATGFLPAQGRSKAALWEARKLIAGSVL
jgi:hypothetical protein